LERSLMKFVRVPRLLSSVALTTAHKPRGCMDTADVIPEKGSTLIAGEACHSRLRCGKLAFTDFDTPARGYNGRGFNLAAACRASKNNAPLVLTIKRSASMDDDLIRLGVIGCGGFGLFTLQQFIQVPGVTLVGMAGTHRPAARAAAARFGVTNVEEV